MNEKLKAGVEIIQKHDSTNYLKALHSFTKHGFCFVLPDWGSFAGTKNHRSLEAKEISPEELVAALQSPGILLIHSFINSSSESSTMLLFNTYLRGSSNRIPKK